MLESPISTDLAPSLSRFINLEKTIIKLIEEIKVTNFNNDTITKSRITLMLTMINMAVKSISRVNKLFEFSGQLEDKLFNENRLKYDLSTAEQIELYELANNRISTYINFIGGTLNSIKWYELEGVLTVLTRIEASDAPEVDKNLVSKAKEIINVVSDLNRSINNKQKESAVEDANIESDEGED